MTRFILEINCDNAAFEGEPLAEVARILTEEAKKLRYWVGDGSKSWNNFLFDVNGNKVGTAKMEGESS